MKIRLQTNGQSTDFCQTGTIMRPNTYEPKEVPIHSRADKQKKESHIPTNNWPAWNNRLYYPRKTIIQCKELQYQKNDKYNVFNHTIYLFSLSFDDHRILSLAGNESRLLHNLFADPPASE